MAQESRTRLYTKNLQAVFRQLKLSFLLPVSLNIDGSRKSSPQGVEVFIARFRFLCFPNIQRLVDSLLKADAAFGCDTLEPTNLRFRYTREINE